MNEGFSFHEMFFKTSWPLRDKWNECNQECHSATGGQFAISGRNLFLFIFTRSWRSGTQKCFLDILDKKRRIKFLSERDTGPAKGEKRGWLVRNANKPISDQQVFSEKVVLARFPDNQTHFVIVTFPPLFRASKCSPGVRYHQKKIPPFFEPIYEFPLLDPSNLGPILTQFSPHSVSRTRKDFTRFLGW